MKHSILNCLFILDIGPEPLTILGRHALEQGAQENYKGLNQV